MRTTSLVLIGEPAQREEIKTCLGACHNMRVTGEIGEIDALRLVPRLSADLVVVDCAAPGLNTLMILPWLHNLPGGPRVVAWGASGSPAERQLVLELGADLYAPPDGLPALLAGLDQNPAPDLSHAA